MYIPPGGSLIRRPATFGFDLYRVGYDRFEPENTRKTAEALQALGGTAVVLATASAGNAI
jgi:hypothetical protein